jgi:hypothetical protein
MNKENKIGPKTEPWGTPVNVKASCEQLLFAIQHIAQSDKAIPLHQKFPKQPIAMGVEI